MHPPESKPSLGGSRVKLPRHFSVKGRPGGKRLHYWSPSPSLRRLGFRDRRLSDDIAIAIREAEELNAEADRYRMEVARVGAGAPLPGTVRWLIRLYKAHDDFIDLAERTRTDYDRHLATLDRLIGSERIDDVTPRVVQAIKRAGAGTPWQTNYLIRVLRLLFSFGVREGYCDHNPARAFRQLRTRPRQAVWTHEQETRFLEACERLGRPSIRLAYMLGIWTAQRRCDVLRMVWSDYDGETLRVRQSKTGRHLVIPVSAQLRQELEAAPRRCPVIVADERGRPYDASHFSHVFKRVARVAGVEGVRYQDLRRTAIVRLAEAGCTVPEIASISGHAVDYCQRIIDTYLPRTRQLAQAAIVKLENRAGTGVGNAGRKRRKRLG